MSWKRGDDLFGRQLRRHKLESSVAAARICQKAEEMYPQLFRAISLSHGILHIELPRAEQLNFKLIEGKLLADLKQYATDKNLPRPLRIRLTFSER